MCAYKNAIARFFICASCVLALSSNSFAQFRGEEKFSDPQKATQPVAVPPTAPAGQTVINPPTAVQPAPASAQQGPLVSKIMVKPETTKVESGKTLKFSADVATDRGASNKVLWSAKLGTVDQDGIYKAPEVRSETKTDVTACSAQTGFTSVCGKAEVTVVPAPSYLWAYLLVGTVLLGLLLIGFLRRRRASHNENLGHNGHSDHKAASSGVTVSVNPEAVTVLSGERFNFDAEVTGASNHHVSWSANIGSIDEHGVYTAPTVTAVTFATVTATADADPSATADARVQIDPASRTLHRPVSSLAVIAALVFCAHSQAAVLVSGCNPCAGAVGQPFTTVISGGDFSNVASVDFAGGGVAGSVTGHSASQLIIAGVVAPGAASTNRQIRLTMTDGTSYYVPNVRFAVDSLDNLRVAQLGAQMAHSTMSNSATSAPVASRPTYLPGRDNTARKTADAAVSKYSDLERRVVVLEGLQRTQSAPVQQVPPPAQAAPPAPQPRDQNAQPSGPAPVQQPVPQALSANTGQAILDRLKLIQDTQAQDRERLNQLASRVGEVQVGMSAIREDVTTVNQTMINGLGVVGGVAIRGLPHKRDRCEALAAYQAAGIRIANPEVLHCSK